MREWWLRRLEGFIDNVMVVGAFGLFLGFVVFVWAVIQELPAVVIFVLVIATLILVEWGLIGLRRLFRHQHSAPRAPSTPADAPTSPIFDLSTPEALDRQLAEYAGILEKHFPQGGAGGARGGGGAGEAGLASIVHPGVEFHPHRQSAEWYGEQLRLGEHVSVLWNSGSILRDQGVLERRKDNLERVLLPHPVQAYTLAPLTGESSEELKKKIQWVTADLTRVGVEIRWWYGNPTNLMTLCSEWVLIETVMPGMKASERPQWKVYRRMYPELWQRLRQVYDQFWREGQEPPAAGDPAWL